MKESHGREISLKLDMKVRWNSTKDMVSQFLMIHNEVRMAILMANSEWDFSDEEIARFCYKTLGLKKGQIKSWDDSLINQQSVGNKAFKIKISNDVDLSKLPLHQGLELKKGLRTKPVKTGSNSTSAGIWIMI